MDTALGKIAVLGGGSWATALAKILMQSCPGIIWYMRRDDRIDEFKHLHHNPAYLTDVIFDTSRIEFSSDINYVCSQADVLLLAMPSPYFKSHIEKISVNIAGKTIVSAIKGIVPDDNLLITDFMTERFGISSQRELVISGPCHAEEVALDRPSYLTIGCHNEDLGARFASLITGKHTRAILSNDVEGIEYAAVLKNVYAIASGIIHGMKMGDNFQAMLTSNAIREMSRFVSAVVPAKRDICDSVYLGDLLVTAYSRFSRNHNFGAMIGKGYSVTAARMEMEQTAEGYYAAKCITDINKNYRVDMPILEAVYDILYRHVSASKAIRRLAESLN
ncbi:MAG: NAD(P)H-dependent glycerol-3-phosphate dehydrogenase [Muribaculaceae bacterium]|nr:NAD(P)H-dependent glycerol-3-phosphate dehydrogenase [Muribaculaceae bacterium]